MASFACIYFAAGVAYLTASLFGYSVGFIGGVLVLPSSLQSLHLLDLSLSALASIDSQIVSIWLFRAVFGALVALPVCSRLGRKSCLAFSAVLYVAGAVL